MGRYPWRRGNFLFDFFNPVKDGKKTAGLQPAASSFNLMLFLLIRISDRKYKRASSS